MKQFTLLAATVLLFAGCSVKMETNHLPNGVVEYKDNVMGMKMTFKKKDGRCLPKATAYDPKYDITSKIKLSGSCDVVAVKAYKDKKLIRTANQKQIKKINKDFKEYLYDRERLKNLQQ